VAGNTAVNFAKHLGGNPNGDGVGFVCHGRFLQHGILRLHPNAYFRARIGLEALGSLGEHGVVCFRLPVLQRMFRL